MPDPEEKTEDTNVDDKKVSDDTSKNDEPTEAALKIQTDFDKKLAEEQAAELAENDKKDDDKTEDDKKTDDEKKAGDDDDSAGKSDSEKAADDKDSSSDKSDSADDKSKLSDELIEAAVKAGMTSEEANEYGSDADLQRTVTLLRRQAGSADTGQEDKTDGKNKGDDSSDKKGDDEKKGDAEDEPFDCGLDPEKYDEGLIKTLNKMGQAQLDALKAKGTVGNKEVEELKAQVKTLTDDRQNEAAVRYFKAFDGRIDALGKDWQDIFGEGPGPKLADDSDGLKNRKVLDKEVQAIAIGRDSAGLKPLSEQAMFDKALESAFPKKSKTLSGKKVSDKLKERSKQHVHKPSGQQGADKTGHEKAVEANVEFDKKLAAEQDAETTA